MPRFREVVRYFAGIDYLEKIDNQKILIKRENKPGIKQLRKIMLEEVKRQYVYPFVIFSRLSGIDAATRRSQRKSLYFGYDLDPYNGPEDFKKYLNEDS